MRRARDAPFPIDEIRRALDSLPQEQQALLRLYWLDGFDFQRIARRLNLPVSRVRLCIARAKTALWRTVSGKGRPFA